MKILENITDDQMVAVFLKGEISSFRFGQQILDLLKSDGKNRNIIDNPDILNPDQNNYRKLLLGEFRGYDKNRLLFHGFPSHILWKKVLLSRNELKKIKYINYNYWVELSGGSRLAADGARNVLKGQKIFGESNDNFFGAAETIQRGNNIPTPILVAKDEVSDLIVLEGHLRLTAYLMVPDHPVNQLEVIVGFSNDINQWVFF